MLSIRTIADRAVHAVEGQRWLDQPGYKLERSFNLLGERGRRLQSVLYGTWLGHPIHPALTDVPLGAWTAGLALDGIDMISPRSGGLGRADHIANGVGILGGFGAAVTGAADWQYTHDTARRVGLTHGVINASALGLYLVSWHARRRGMVARSRGAGVLGYVLAVTAAYLGGDLVFRHRIGVDRSEISLEPREFVPVLVSADLSPDEPRRVRHDGVAGPTGLTLASTGRRQARW